jgi:hypothetical protein
VDTLNITAPAVLNAGGDIAANNISISAKTFDNRPERFGAQVHGKSCLLFFCRRTIENSVRHDGCNIYATDTLAITASTYALNLGGTLSGTNGITLTAPDISLRGNMVYDSFSRPTGLHGLFRGKSDYLFFTFLPGPVLSADGVVTFESENIARIEATTMTQKEGATAGTAHVFDDIDVRLRAANERHIGLFRSLLSGSK